MGEARAGQAAMRPGLGLFDVTSLVIGAIVGADIYVASSFGAGLLGPAALIAWVAAGVMAMVIALSFAQAAMLVPRVGGSYEYVREAFGSIPGFAVGWALWLAEWTSLAVFPIAFSRYVSVFFPLSPLGTAGAKVVFVIFLTVSNYLGTRAAGRVNDVLTVAKMGPLIFFALLGLLVLGRDPALFRAHLTPLAPLGWSGFGPALVAIFWAYAGFELAVIPAGEIDNPQRTIPTAIGIGLSVVLVFYLATNLAVFGVVPWQQLATSGVPLTDASRALLHSFFPRWAVSGGMVMAGGAVLSVLGSDESGTLGTSRLGYAMAVEGYAPAMLARLHPRYGTPYVALLFQNTAALVAALVGTLGSLIKVAVFNLGIVYFVTCLAVLRLHARARGPAHRGVLERAVPYAGLAAATYLVWQVGWREKLMGLCLLALGLPIYLLSSRRQLPQRKAELLAWRRELVAAGAHSERFLAHAVKHLVGLVSPRVGRR